jgi:hypothetical protein
LTGLALSQIEIGPAPPVSNVEDHRGCFTSGPVAVHRPDALTTALKPRSILMPNSWIFVPASGDSVVDLLAQNLPDTLADGDAVTTGPGDKKLGNIDKNNNPTLFIAGHGNFGLGIGTHKTHYGARRLVRMLLDEGLGKTQVNLAIHLVACNSGVSCRRKLIFPRREPYVKRFAEALAAQQFTGVTVIGYAGFVTADVRSTLGYNLRTKTNDQPSYRHLYGLGSVGRQVIYTVTSGGATKTAGDDWESFTGVGPKAFGQLRIDHH